MLDLNDFFAVKWVEEFHQELIEKANEVSKGWIIDLTENSGGNFLPMIAAVGPLFSNKELGGFYTLNENNEIEIVKLTYEEGNVKYNGELAFHYPYFQIDSDSLSIAVLIGEQTASSGEFLSLAFQRQPHTILLGEPTYGVATTNQHIELPEEIGGYFELTVAYALDKNDGPLTAQKVFPDKEFIGSKNDLFNLAMDYINSYKMPDQKSEQHDDKVLSNINVLKLSDVISDEPSYDLQKGPIETSQPVQIVQLINSECEWGA